VDLAVEEKDRVFWIVVSLDLSWTNRAVVILRCTARAGRMPLRTVAEAKDLCTRVAEDRSMLSAVSDDEKSSKLLR